MYGDDRGAGCWKKVEDISGIKMISLRAENILWLATSTSKVKNDKRKLEHKKRRRERGDCDDAKFAEHFFDSEMCS